MPLATRQKRTRRAHRWREVAACDQSIGGRKRRYLMPGGTSSGTNNSMPFADKAYTAPEPPMDASAYKPGLVEPAIKFREAVRGQRPHHHVTVNFRARRSNYEQILDQCISTGVFTKASMYSSQNLPYWTVGMRLRIRYNYPLGRVLHAIRCRLGITQPGFVFCLDGFYGMANFADVFGHVGACPWMELSKFSTVTSLHLADGDNIYLSIATPTQVAAVTKCREKAANRLAALRASSRVPGSRKGSTASSKVVPWNRKGSTASATASAKVPGNRNGSIAPASAYAKVPGNRKGSTASATAIERVAADLPV